MKKLMFALACVVLTATMAQAGPVIVDLGTGAPPSGFSGYTMTAISDARPVIADVTDVASPLGGVVGFSIPVSHREIGAGWATWSHGYTGDVYYSNGATSVTLTMPADTGAFYLYAEPNPFNFFTITVSSGGKSSSMVVSGDSGAWGWGFYDDAMGSITSISVSSTVDFAIGEFGIAKTKVPNGVPDPGSSLVLLGLGLAGLAWRKRA